MELSLYFPPEYLRAGLLVSLLSVWLLVGLFAYLNHYTKRRYFTMWTAAWLFYALWLALGFGHEASPAGHLIQMVRQWCVGVSAVFLFWGSLVFMGQRQRQTTFGLFLLFLLVWSYVGVYYVQDRLQAELPIFAILGIASFRTAYCFFVYRRTRPYMGASLLTVGLALWGIYLGGYPFWQAQDKLRAGAFFYCAALQLFIAVSMIVLVLEEAKASLQRVMETNRSNRAACAGLQNQVRSTEDRYRKLFEQASDGIVITSTLNLDILDLNQRAQHLLMITHFEPGGPSLRSFLEGLPQGETSTRGAEAFECIRAQHTLNLVAANGSKTPVEIEGSAIEFEGQPAYQFAFREVTERVRLEQQLRQAEKLSALGQMISGVAHELNNPLAVIKGYLELILSRDPLAEQTRQDLRKVADESTHAAKLVANFLSFAREQPTVRVKTLINEVVDRVVSRARLDLTTAQVSMQLNLTRDLPQILVDPDKIEQVLDNLVKNAIQALAGQQVAGLVRISTDRVNGTVRVLVEDNGPGVPEHLAAKIFEPFFTTKEVGKGTGLGLSISHSIMTEHNGRIYQQTSRLGGACFILELPVSFEKAKKSPSLVEPVLPALSSGPQRPVRPARILILDDERALAEMLEQLVQHLGHHSTVCLSPLDALKQIQAADFDLIFSDYRMPDLDGRQFYQRVSQLKPHLTSRIVFLTGDVANEETQDFLASIGNPTITKPFHLHVVESTINKTLQTGGGPAKERSRLARN